MEKIILIETSTALCSVALAEDGKITAAEITGDAETPEVGGAALEPLAEQLVAAGNADIDEYGSLGWEVTVWETCIRFRMRDFLKREFTDLESAIYQF